MESSRSNTKAGNRTEYNEMPGNRLTGQQYAVIRLAATIGDDIRMNYPEIAEDYRSGLTAPQLVAKYGFDHRYEIGRQVANSAVRNAIRGYSGYCHDPYDGLIADESERAILAFAHNKQTGMEMYEQKRGIHALTREQKVDFGRKSGLIRGPLSYRLRIGCHALSPEVLREHCRRIAPLGGKAGGAASVVARGLVPYASAEPGRVAEIEFAFRLAADPRYLGPVRSNFRKIAEKINEVFHSGNPHHTRTTLKLALQSYRRRDRSATESHADQEMSFAEKLASDPAYQLPARIKAAQIARKVNEEYHDGRPVRNPLGIRTAIQRYRRQNASQTAGEFLESLTPDTR
jgi:hypothetical protein